MADEPTRPACPACGAATREQDRFCWHCGAGRQQSFPPAGGQPAQPAVSSAALVLLAVLLALAGSAAVCSPMSGGARPGLAVVGVILGLTAVWLLLVAGRQMAAKR